MGATRNKPPDPVQHVAAFFEPRLQRGQRICVALSGGADSVALLHALAALRSRFKTIELGALHVHHGLSANADAWAAFCGRLCHELKIPLRTEWGHVDRHHGEGLEAAARRARYHLFAQTDADWLALAQHRDDQAETLLLNLLRGSGIHGLAAMPEERPLRPNPDSARNVARALALALEPATPPPFRPMLVRPFLSVPRKVLEDWLVSQGLSWVEDESNTDRRFRRNFIRHELLPLMAQSFPDPSNALARAAAHLAESRTLAEEIAESDTRQAIADDTSLRIAHLSALSPARAANLLRHWLGLRGVRMPDTRYLAEMLRQLASAESDSAPEFLIDGIQFQASQGYLHSIPEISATHQTPTQLWQGEARLDWQGGHIHFQAVTGLGLSQRALENTQLELRLRQGGETLKTDPRRPRQRLKKHLQTSGTPLWLRGKIPLLWSNDRLVWVHSMGFDAASIVTSPEEPGWWPEWHPPKA